MLAALPAAAYVCGVPGFAPFFLLIPLFWLIVIVLVVTLVGRRWRSGWGGRGPGWGGTRPAEALLAERFARGDIDETEYVARLDALRANQ